MVIYPQQLWVLTKNENRPIKPENEEPQDEETEVDAIEKPGRSLVITKEAHPVPQGQLLLYQTCSVVSKMTTMLKRIWFTQVSIAAHRRASTFGPEIYSGKQVAGKMADS